MKRVIGIIEMISGACLAISGVIVKDTYLTIIGCMLMICGKIDLNSNNAETI